MLSWALLASGQINMTVGRRLPQPPWINRLTSLRDSVSQKAGDHVTPNSNTSSDGTTNNVGSSDSVPAPTGIQGILMG
jgi:hypothetical protein